MELYTRRLCLEPLEPRHADAFFDELQCPQLYDYIADTPPPNIEALRERYRVLASLHSPDGTELWLNWAVWSLTEERYVGYVQATVYTNNSIIIAYVFFPHAWGKGYAREAVTRMIDYLTETYYPCEFCAYVDVRNHRSIALLKALGFACFTVHKDAGVIQGVLSDEAEYRKTAKDR